MKTSSSPFSSDSRLLILTNVVAIIMAGSIVAQAQSDNFNDGNDTGWTRYDPLAAVGAPPASYTFPGGAYGIQSAASPAPGTFGKSRAGSLRNDVSYTDFTMIFDVVDWNNSLDQAFGALARISQLGLGSTDGYAFTYATDGSIDISRILNEAPTGLGSASITLNPANDYRFVFSGTGANLTGQVFDLANLSAPLATLNASDATYASGNSGFVVFDNSPAGTGTTFATFDNYVTVVPEPSTTLLLIPGLVGVYFWSRRRNRSVC